MNRYQASRWLGVVFVAIGVGALALTYPPSVSLGAQMVAMALAGALFVLSGTENRFRERVGPHRLMGVGDIALGASITVSALETQDGNVVYLAAAVLGGGSLAFIGLCYVFRPSVFGLDADGYPVQSS